MKQPSWTFIVTVGLVTAISCLSVVHGVRIDQNKAKIEVLTTRVKFLEERVGYLYTRWNITGSPMEEDDE